MPTSTDKSGIKERLKSFGNKLLKSDSFIYAYIRSLVPAQAAGWLDVTMGFVLFAWCGISPLWATALGAISGGVLSCIIHYRFVFHADGCDWRAVGIKYAVVWVGSLLLNSFGTDALYRMIDNWTWLINMGFHPDAFYVTARIIAALIVSLPWNFVLHRYFVYRPLPIDKYLSNFLAIFGIGKESKYF